MTVSVADMRKAVAEGLGAIPGTANPYAGKPVLAQAWRSGYGQMLAAAVDKADARH